MYLLESPHRSDSNKYTQHTIIVKEIKKKSLNYRYLLPDLAPWLTLSGSNYPCLEQFSMAPEMFEPLKFDCISKLRVPSGPRMKLVDYKKIFKLHDSLYYWGSKVLLWLILQGDLYYCLAFCPCLFLFF